MATARVTLVAHTHWDREWYEPFEVFRARLLDVLDEALDLLEADPRLTFTLDGQVALVDDYLELRPSAEARVRALVQAGRLHVGPWYTAADTLLTDGEAVIRNLARGIRRAEELGGAMRFGYMPDQFGHGAQVPQMLRACGIESAAVWRGVGPERPPHAFRWVAPDGSAVTTLWLQDGYATGRRLPSDREGFAAAVERSLERLAPWLGDAPLVLPVGDDHVRLAAWLPDAAETLRVRRPGLFVQVGGYPEHVPHVGEPAGEVRGELRSPAFAPVLAGTASARVREKQAAMRATALLTRYAEPLAAWSGLVGGTPPRELIDRAWRHLIHNHAHDSAAGCGVDATHEDVKARHRWAEQLAGAARDRALATLAFTLPDAPAAFVAFHPGPAAAALTVEVDVPRALGDKLVARGPDGIARPVQALDEEGEQPLFEGEFAAAELGGYLGGLDPATPLFGRFLTGITIHPDGPGRLRLDVGLGEAPVPRAQLEEDQKRVAALLGTAERFRVVLHAGGTTRRALVAAGPAPAAAFVPISVEAAGEGAPAKAPGCGADGEAAIRAGALRVAAQPDGSVLITDEDLGLSVRANDLVDEGDRGDLYHFDRAAGPTVRARSSRATVIESGPLRARMRIEQILDLPLGLLADRGGRVATTRPSLVVTDVTVHAGERRVEFSTTFENEAHDHRLRALAHLPFTARRLDAELGLAVVARPLDPQALGAGLEKPSPTGQHHHFVDASDGTRGAALLTRGLLEHELLPGDGGSALALTLLRAVGWLSRGDLACIDQAVGPMVPTPGAQELGTHRCDYALLLHPGGWHEGGVLAEARRFTAPPFAFSPSRGARRTAPLGRALVEVEPSTVMVTALHPAQEGRGVVVRLLNASAEPALASLRCALPVTDAVEVDPLERPLSSPSRLRREADRLILPLGGWQLATVLLRS